MVLPSRLFLLFPVRVRRLLRRQPLHAGNAGRLAARAQLAVHAEAARASLGDGLQGRVGSDVRPIGRVDRPVPLTAYDPDHPYYLAEYDLTDRG